MNIADKIIGIAEEFEGLVEVISNEEWDDPKTKGKDPHAAKFEAMLKRAGHQDGWAYCMSFCEGVLVTAYDELGLKQHVLRARTLLSPSVMNSYKACREAGVISKVPHRGAIGFMQSGGKWQGHAFLVTAVDGSVVHTIEANTSPTNAQERDGGIGTGGVYRKRRQIVYVPRESGLHLRGFLNPFV
jgi:hypothetical protein